MAIERRLSRHTTALIAPSASLRDELMERGVGRQEQWRVIPYGIDLRTSSSTRVSARDQLRLPRDVPLVGIVGRLAPVKNHAAFLEVAALIAAQRPDVSFVIAGEGELRGDIERQVAANLPGRVHLLGHVREIDVFYAAIDVLALTSRSEGTPVSAIEAAAAGVPTVAVDVGGVSSIVEHGTTGMLLAPGDVAGFASAVSELLSSPDFADRLGQAARAAVGERFGSDALARRTAALYRESLSRRR